MGFKYGRYKTHETFKLKRQKSCFENTISKLVNFNFILAKSYWVKCARKYFIMSSGGVVKPT